MTDTVTISTAGSAFDTVLGVYTGLELSSLNEVASNDDDPAGGVTSLVMFNATSNTTYQVAVDGYSAAYGPVALRIVVGVPPVITAQPQSQTVMAGTDASFSCVATGTPPLAFQWRHAGTNIPGATGASYSRTNVQLADAGFYSVVVTNHAGAVTSSNSLLTVNAPPLIASQPQSQTVIQGETAAFSVVATGSPVLRYQWRFNDTDLPGATTSSFARLNTAPADEGYYTVLVTNTFGAITSAPARLTVLVPPTIDVQPQSRTVAPGAHATFTVSATGTAPLSYQWTFDGDPIAGATTSAYTRSNVQPAHAGDYAVVVTNLAGSVTSSNATLSVMGPQPLVLSAAQRLGNGQFQFTVSGTPGQHVVVQASANLTAWLSLSTNILTNGTLIHLDTTATNFGRRFYRGQSAP